MTGLRRNPHLYEINACLFIRRLSQKYGRTLTLNTVPDAEWQELARLGFDLVWLMGVWERSAASRREALRHEGLRREYGRALPGWTDEDVSGSPYAVHNYKLDPSLGKPDELAGLKSKLNRLGMRLILDFVPNHLATDHPWLAANPQRFVRGKPADVQSHRDWFFSPDGTNFFAHGRDPYFPPWTDTAQVNFYSHNLRQALTGELERIAETADGVRCDMAMLALNDVFGRIWDKLVDDPRPPTEFWTEAVGRVKHKNPEFLFMAEAYWDTERQLQQLGFDFTYDKTLYDRLKSSDNAGILVHLRDEAYQQRSVHFIENHDEQRAVTAFGKERSLAAAVVISTVPGLRLYHDGQLEGFRTRIPIQLARQPDEAADSDIRRFYERLLAAANSPAFHDGEWAQLDFEQSGNRQSNVLAWSWQYEGHAKIVAVNYSQEQIEGGLILPLNSESVTEISLREELKEATKSYNLNREESRKLRLELNPWEAQILDITLDQPA